MLNVSVFYGTLVVLKPSVSVGQRERVEVEVHAPGSVYTDKWGWVLLIIAAGEQWNFLDLFWMLEGKNSVCIKWTNEKTAEVEVAIPFTA